MGRSQAEPIPAIRCGFSPVLTAALLEAKIMSLSPKRSSQLALFSLKRSKLTFGLFRAKFWLLFGPKT